MRSGSVSDNSGLENAIIKNQIHVIDNVLATSFVAKRSLRFPLFFLLFFAAGALGGCAGYPRTLQFPNDSGGRGLNSPAADFMPRIADRYIVFASDRGGSQDIYLYDAEARALVDLPGLNALNAIASHPSISVDGRYIAFMGIRKGESNIYLYNRDTRQLRNLTRDMDAEVRHPVLSADGSTVAFESSANGQWDIVLRDRNGEPLDVPVLPE